jgi:superfamily I DNA/RNA helicase
MRPQSIALLLRARTHLKAFTDALIAAGIPFRVGGGAGFYRQPAVRLIASLLQFLQDPEDRSAAAHIWENPVLGIGYWGWKPGCTALRKRRMVIDHRKTGGAGSSSLTLYPFDCHNVST